MKEFRGYVWASLAVSLGFGFTAVATGHFVAGVKEYSWGYYAVYGRAAGPYLVASTVILLLALAILYERYSKASSETERKRLKGILWAFTLGYLACVDYLPAFGVEWYPAGYLAVAAFLVMTAWTILRYRLYDITPAFAAGEIIDIMGEALVVFDTRGVVQFMNPAARELFSRESETSGPGIAAALAAEFRSLRQGGRLQNHEMQFASKEGAPRTLSFSATVQRAGETPVAFVFVVRDVTEQKAADRALLEKTAELARSKAELDQLELFAFVASHDLQEPLRKIISFGERVSMQLAENTDERVKDNIERMRSAALRMSQYIEDLVQFSRVMTKAHPFENVSLDGVLAEVLADLELRISEAGAEVKVEALPTIHADRLQMRQLFQNLVANALKFRREGHSSQVQVSSVPAEPGWVEVSVRDNGIGFDEKYTEKIFRPFERLHGRDYEGSGMGLAICQRIVLRHGGRISVKSAVGSGAEFVITLPLPPSA
jgi:PAS domain S-box-containing protein